MTLQTPSQDHLQFDQLCAEVDEFEPLPAISSAPLEFEHSEEETGLDDQILAGLDDQILAGLDDQILAALVSPAY